MRHENDRNERGGKGRHNAGRKFAAIMAFARGCGEAGAEAGRVGSGFGEGFPFGGTGPFGGEFPLGRGGHGGGGPRGKGGRGRRGMFGRDELRLLLLSLIAEEPRHGYDLIKVLEERSSGHYAPSPGVIYPALALLADEGLIAEQPGDDNRRRFALTPDGEKTLADEQEQVGQLAERLVQLADRAERGRRPQIERASMNLAMAIGQRLKQGGGDELAHDIAAILDDAARQIERL